MGKLRLIKENILEKTIEIIPGATIVFKRPLKGCFKLAQDISSNIG